MKTAYELAVSVCNLLSEMEEHATKGSDTTLIAREAHAQALDLAAVLSPDPGIRASMAQEQPPRTPYWPVPTVAS